MIGGWPPREWRDHDRRVREQLRILTELIIRVDNRTEKILSAQDDINTAVAALQADSTGLAASVEAILAEIANLQGQGVDTSGLTAAVADLQTHVDAVNAIPAPPAA